VRPWPVRRVKRSRRGSIRICWKGTASASVGTCGVFAIGIGGTVDWMVDGGFISDHFDMRQADTFGQHAAVAYAALAQTNPQPLPVVSLDGLSASVSKALGVAVHFHDTASAGFTLLGGWVMPGSRGQAVQLAFRDTKDHRLITFYLEGCPGAKETPFRRVAGTGVTTVAWEDDDLACAISGTVEPARLEQIGRRIYDALLS
jgi:anti-sigma factor RsiW